MKRNIKHGIIICLVLIISFCFSSPVFATNELTLLEQIAQTFTYKLQINFSQEAGYSFHKKVEPSNELNKFQVIIELKKHRNTPLEKENIVFLLDNSLYNNGDEFLQEQKAFLEDVISLFFSEESEKEIALITIDSDVVNYGWHNISQKDKLLENIQGVTAKTGSYLQLGLDKATEIAKEKDGIVVMLSSGHATYSHRIKDFEAKVICKENHEGQRWTITPTFMTPYVRVGNGTGTASLPRQVVPDTMCNWDKIETYHGRYPETHMMVVADYYKELSNGEVELFTIGIGLEEEDFGYDYLVEMNHGFLPTEREDALKFLKEVGGITEEKILSSSTLTEFSHPLVKINKESVSATQGMVELQEDVLTWTSDENGTLSYMVELQVEDPSFSEDTDFSLATNSIFSYNLDNEEIVKSIAQPQIQGHYNEIFIMGIEVNQNGDFIDDGGNIVLEESQGAVAAPKIGLNNSQGVNQWGANQEVIVPESMLQPKENYTLYVENQSTQKVILTNESQSAVVYFYYVKPVYYEYQVHHVLEGEAEPFIKRNYSHIEHGTVITQVEDLSGHLELSDEKYYQVSVEAVPVEITKNGIVIVAVYEKEESEVPIPIEYPLTKTSAVYPSEEILDTEKLLLTEDYWIVEALDIYNGYDFYQAETNGNFYNIGEEIPLIAGEENNIVLYYKKSLISPPVTYYVDIYFDGILSVEQSYSRTLSLGEDTILFQPVYNVEEYIFSFWEFQFDQFTTEASIVFEENKERISVYYNTPNQPVNNLMYEIDVFFESEPAYDFWESGEVPEDQPFLFIDPELILGDYYFKYIEYNGIRYTGPITLELTQNNVTIKVQYEANPNQSKQFYTSRYYNGEPDPRNPIVIYNIPSNEIIHDTDIPNMSYNMLYNRVGISPNTPIPYSYEMMMREDYEIAPDESLEIGVFIYLDGSLLNNDKYYLSHGDSILPLEELIHEMGMEDELDTIEMSGHFQDNDYTWIANNQGDYIVTFWQNQVHLYYTSDFIDDEEVSYTVNYYYDGILDKGKTEVITTFKNQMITTIEKKEKHGFSYGNMEPSLPFKLENANAIFSVYYFGNNNDNDTEIPNIEFNRQIPVNYTFIESSGQEERWTDEAYIPMDQWISFWHLFQDKTFMGKRLKLKEIILLETVSQEPMTINLGMSGEYGVRNSIVTEHQVEKTDYLILSSESDYSLQVMYDEDKGYIETDKAKDPKKNEKSEKKTKEVPDKASKAPKTIAESKNTEAQTMEKPIKSSHTTNASVGGGNSYYGTLPQTGWNFMNKKQIINLLLAVTGSGLFAGVLVYKKRKNCINLQDGKKIDG